MAPAYPPPENITALSLTPSAVAYYTATNGAGTRYAACRESGRKCDTGARAWLAAGPSCRLLQQWDSSQGPPSSHPPHPAALVGLTCRLHITHTHALPLAARLPACLPTIRRPAVLRLSGLPALDG